MTANSNRKTCFNMRSKFTVRKLGGFHFIGKLKDGSFRKHHDRDAGAMAYAERSAANATAAMLNAGVARRRSTKRAATNWR